MKTSLYAAHCGLGAKLVDFSGWEMPLHYTSVLEEHLAVRQRVGLFDVSHMGKIWIRGEKAEDFLDYVSTNKMKGRPDFSATYTVLCNEEGGCVDDVIVYRENRENFFVVANASNRQKDLEHLRAQSSPYRVAIEPDEASGIIAVQGPKAKELLSSFFPSFASLKPMRFASDSYRGEKVTVASTGYTGAGGGEIYVPHTIVVSLWQDLLDKGKVYGIAPVGLGARDTLRLEKGYALYGHELSETIYPTESVAAWAVHREKTDFLGKASLEKMENSSLKRRAYGIVLQEKGIARAGSVIFFQERKVGETTSGNYSPSLHQSIALILSSAPLKAGDIVEAQVRQKTYKAKVTDLPFL